MRSLVFPLLARVLTGTVAADFSFIANVLTNIPFLLIGLFGLRLTAPAPGRRDSSLADPLVAFMLSLILVGIGSIFYHLSPSPDRLFWDRLPIAICLAAFACAAANVCRESGIGSTLLPYALVVAGSSVVYWYVTWLRGHEDLRFYAAVQIVAAGIGVIVAFRRPDRFAGAGELRVAMFFYLSARILELFQQRIFDRVGTDLAHPLKHLLVAFAAWKIVRALSPAGNRARLQGTFAADLRR